MCIIYFPDIDWALSSTEQRTPLLYEAAVCHERSICWLALKKNYDQITVGDSLATTTPGAVIARGCSRCLSSGSSVVLLE